MNSDKGSRKEKQPMQRLMSVKEAAAYTGLSPYTIYTMVSQRRIPYVKVGRLTKFDVGLLDAWIKQNTVMPMPPKVG
jgi:excisionase family DNA binding protein